MMAPLPTPSHVADRPELPRVRLEVRATSGRHVTYEVGADDFLIGCSAGCDLRLPASNLPPVICQISRKTDGVRVRRITPVLPVHINGNPLPTNTTTSVASGDVLALAEIEIIFAIQYTPDVVIPKFVPLEVEAAAPTPERSRTDLIEEHRKLDERRTQLDAEEAARREDWTRRDGELVRRARDLDRQTEELESDRVIWYGRRQEIERELERQQAALGIVGIQKSDLDAKERELGRLKDELSSLRERLLKEYQGRRDELARQQEELGNAKTRFQADMESHRDKLESDVASRRSAMEDEFRQRREKLETELFQHEPKLRELRDQQERIDSAARELARSRELFATDRETFDKARATFEASQAAETERLMTWENTLVDRVADVTRQTNELKDDRVEFDRDRVQLQEDLIRFERRTLAIEERELAAANRSREAEVRLEQLKRDAIELEESVVQVTAEEARLRTEADRLDRQKAELDAQSAMLTDRSGQLEAQQAVLAVQRAKLDRAHQDAEREASQLAAARMREDEALAELRERIREAEELRAELATVHESATLDRQRLEERDSLLSSGLAEIRQQQESLAVEMERLHQKEAELDAQAAEFAEQAGTLKGRMSQALDLQARLEADRIAIREREAALAQAEDARSALQEQLRRRAEDLASRAAALDALARKVVADRAAVEQIKTSTEAVQLTIDDQVSERRREVEERASELERLAEEYSDKDEAVARQVAKLKDVGAAVGAERKALADARRRWETERQAAIEADRKSREELAAFREQAAAEIVSLREQAPELEGQTQASLERLSAARDILRGHLAELHDFARLSREDLDAVRIQIRLEADRLREQEESLNRAKAEHRLAVAAFRQQLVEWQGQVTEMKRTLTHSESRLDARQAAVDQAAKNVDATTIHLAEQAEHIRRERDAVSARRIEMERHLTEMREWYRKKLRELAANGAETARARSGDDVPTLKLHDTASTVAVVEDDLNPGDKQLGELLQSHGLVDSDTLTALWSEAGRQRRTLRQVLLVSGAITLYQLALIEAGNLDALVLGRFRVIDRLRATPREAIYRVFDPAARRTPQGNEGFYLLRHLSEGEMHDAIHPDEFRQRFAAARDAKHPNLASVHEVLEINGRPAIVQEWLTGLFSADWAAQAADPGCWVRLASMAAAALDAAHRHGLVHGRLTSDSFILTAAGVVKLTGLGEPTWLTIGPASSIEPTAASDLRAFGQVAFGWSQLALRRKGAAKSKPFPETLLAIIRRLEADPEPPMADTVATGKPYESAAELVADLARLARETSFSDEAWEKLLKHVAENAPEAPASIRRSA